MQMTLTYKSQIEMTSTDKGFIIIKQTAPQTGQIVIHISDLNGFVGMLSTCATDASKPSRPPVNTRKS